MTDIYAETPPRGFETISSPFQHGDADSATEFHSVASNTKPLSKGFEMLSPPFQRGETNINWRFLPAIPASGSTLVIGAKQDVLATVYDPLVCLPALPSNRHTYPVNQFDFAAFPNQPPPLAHLANLRSWVRATGTLYIGLSGKRSQRQNLSIQQWVRRLRMAGFPQVSVFGALPNSQAPTYFFPLTTEAMTFALRRYLRGRRKAERLAGLVRPRMLARLRWYLPAYGIVAGREG